MLSSLRQPEVPLSGCGCELEARDERERTTLRAVLAINAVMFVVELGLGLAAQSTGLVADSLDMLADASVYAISLFAVGGAASRKLGAARLSGVLQVLLALLVLADVARRFVRGSEPASAMMVGVGALALVANAVCLALVSRHRDGGAHMRASYVFSQSDVVANAGVIISGVLVSLLGSRIPDLAIGCAIAAFVLRGGIVILRDAASPACEGERGHAGAERG